MISGLHWLFKLDQSVISMKNISIFLQKIEKEQKFNEKGSFRRGSVLNIYQKNRFKIYKSSQKK